MGHHFLVARPLFTFFSGESSTWRLYTRRNPTRAEAMITFSGTESTGGYLRTPCRTLWPTQSALLSTTFNPLSSDIVNTFFSAQCALTRLVCWFRSYLDVVKVFVFNFMYWITLAVVFVAGTSRISCKYQKITNQSINQPKYQSINQSINRNINQSINQSINQLKYQSINQSINRSIVCWLLSVLCFFYLIACFFFLWHGNEFFRKPIRLLQRQWETFTLWIFLLKMEFCWRKSFLTNFSGGIFS